MLNNDLAGRMGLAAVNRERPLDPGNETKKRVCRRFVPPAIYDRYMGVKDLENTIFRVQTGERKGEPTGTKTRVEVGETDFILKVKNPGELEWTTVDISNHEAMRGRSVRMEAPRRLPENRSLRPIRTTRHGRRSILCLVPPRFPIVILEAMIMNVK